MSEEQWAQLRQTYADERSTSGRSKLLGFLARHPKDLGDPLQQCAYTRVLLGWLMYEGPLPAHLHTHGGPSPEPPFTYRQLKRRHEKEIKQQREREGHARQEPPGNP